MWPNTQFPTDLVTFTKEILHEKLHFFFAVINIFWEEINVLTFSKFWANKYRFKIISFLKWILTEHRFYIKSSLSLTSTFEYGFLSTLV